MCSRLHILTLVVLGLVLLAPARARQLKEPPTAGQQAATGTLEGESGDGMVLIASGTYAPLYRSPGEASDVAVGAFLVDTHPVTNQEFLAFVRSNPKWQRSHVPALFADEGYLRHWSGDTLLGVAGLAQPVTNISWFAAKAYASWKGNRLPTTEEWEYLAGASKTSADGHADPAFAQELLRVTTMPSPVTLPDVGISVPNFWGVHDMHGLVWEWVADFNSALITGESRGDANLERKLFCGAGVIGASDFTDYAAFMRFSFRGSLSAQYAGSNLGFRTVRSAPTPGI